MRVRLRLKGLTAVDVVVAVGASQAGPTFNSVTELPSGYYTTDAAAFIWNSASTNGVAAGQIRPLTAATFATVTISNASPAVVTQTAHGLAANTPLGIETTGALPTGLATATRYFVKTVLDANTYTVSATAGGAAINTSSAGSGTHTMVANGGLECQPDGTGTDGSLPNAVGWCGEFTKHYRADHASSPIYFFIHRVGGGRFSDAGARGRTCNWSYSLTDGAYASFKTQWAAFVVALAAIGKRPNIILVMDDSIGNGAQDATQTEANAYQTAMSNLITQARTDVVGSSVKWVHCRLSSQMTAAALDSTAKATIRAAQQAIVTATPTTETLLQCDGLQTATDLLHFKANSHLTLGELLYYRSAGYWDPLTEWGFLSGNQTTHLFFPGSFENAAGSTAFTLAGGNIQTFWDFFDGSILPDQATDANRPVIGTTTLSNGYVARFATGDGIDDGNVSASGTAITASGNWGVLAAIKGPATANKFFFGVGGAGANPFIGLGTKGDGTGKLVAFHTSDTNVQTSIDSTVVAFNNTVNFVYMGKTGSSWPSQVNGTAGTTQTFTPGTTTLDRTSLFALNTSAGTLSAWMNASTSALWTATSAPDATYLANARAYCQRRWGTA